MKDRQVEIEDYSLVNMLNQVEKEQAAKARRAQRAQHLDVREKVLMGKKSAIAYYDSSEPPHLMSTADLLRTHYSPNPPARKRAINAELERRNVYDPEGLAMRWGII